MKKQNKWLDNYGKADNANESNVTLPEGFVGMGYDTSGRNYSPAWGGQFQTGGSIPGTVGFTYARTINPAPSEGKYAKKTMASAQNGQEMKFYQEGLDWKPKSMQDGGQQPLQVSTIDPRYPELYKNRQLGRWLDENTFDSQVPLDEVTVRPKSYSMDSLRDFTKAAMYGVPESLMKLEQIPTATLAETAAMLTGKPYDFSNINPNLGQWGSNQRDLSIFGYENPEGFMQNAVNMGLSAIDPAMIAGLARNPVKNITRTFTDNLNYSKSINPQRNIVGDELKPAFGFARGNETFVRGDLPERVKNFVQAHEDYHVYDYQKYPNASNSFLRRELPANFFPALKDPIGFAATVKHSLTPERLKFYMDRLRSNPETLQKITPKMDDVQREEILRLLKNTDEMLSRNQKFLDQEKGLGNIRESLKNYRELGDPNNVNIDESLSSKIVSQTVGDENFKFKPYTDQWFQNNAERIRATQGEPKLLKQEDFYSVTELEKEIEDYANYQQALKQFDEQNPWNPSNAVMDALTGNTSRDELFKTLFPNVRKPTFSEKIVMPEIRNELKDILQTNTSLNPFELRKNTLKRINTDYDRPHQIVNQMKSYDDSFWNNPKDVVSEFRELLRLEPEQIDKLPQHVIEKLASQIKEKMKKQNFDTFKEQSKFTGKDAFQNLPINRQGGVIKDNRGQWDHPGEITEIDSPYITMQGVPYDVLGVSDTGDTKLMLPGENYKFKGKKVTEFPLAQWGKGIPFKDAVNQPKNPANPIRADLVPSIENFKTSESKNKNWVNWEDIKKQNDQINNLSDYDKIIATHYKPKSLEPQYQNDSQVYTVKKGENLSTISKKLGVDVQDIIRQNNIKNPNLIQIGQELKITPKQKNYVIVDKKKGMMQVFKEGENKPYRTYEVGVGERAGDAQTTTKIIDGKTDWDSSNFNTGAGVYTISNANPKNKQYYNVPSFNLLNDRGIEVATAIHAAPSSRWNKISDGIFTNNKVSTGCINGVCGDMQDMYNIGLGKGDLVYVLPEDEGNYFEVIDGKPVFRAKSKSEYDTYTDKRGTQQKGQGVNRSVNTLNYKPIQAEIKPEKQNETNLNFTQALVDNKQKVMQAAQIPSDVYNEIAKVAFGILGTETNFGEEHTAVGNFARAVNKWLDPENSSSPDYISKFYTYRATGENNSVGPTQLRFSYLNDDEKNVLKKLGITNNEQLMDPKNAAVATTAILGVRYNQQLTPSQKKDIMQNLPSKWNTRDNYSDRVKNASQYLTLKQQMMNGGKVNINDLDAQPKKKLNQLLNFTNNPDKNWLDNL